MMKWVLGAAALASCGWASATWVHSSQAASQYEVSLAAFGLRHGVELVEVGYERSLLSSVARTEVRQGAGVSQYAEFVPESWREDSRLVLKHVIQHGPLILDDGVSTLAARVVTTLDFDSLNAVAGAALREACGCEEPLRVVSEVKHDGSLSHLISSHALMVRSQQEAGELAVDVGAVHGQLTTDREGRVAASGELGAISGSVGPLRFRHQPTTWTYSGIAADIAGLGTFEARSPGLTLDGEGASIAVNGLKAKSRNVLEGGQLNGAVQLGFESLSGPITLGPQSMTATVSGIAESAVSQYTRAISTADFNTVEGRKRFMTSYLALFSPGSALRIALESQSASGHRAELEYSVAYAHARGQLNTVGDLLNRIRGGIEAEVAVDWLRETGLEQAAPALYAVTVPVADRLTLNASLSNGQAELNGQSVPIDQMFGPALAQPLPSMQALASQWIALEQQQLP